MPTVLRSGPYRFYFYAGDREEPMHVHVKRDEMEAKVWLDPVWLARNKGFSRTELNKILRLVAEHRQFLMDQWNEYFNG
ncbi:MAG: DUF4160 domain-containing protein [Phycisphaeraceae bacterium]